MLCATQEEALDAEVRSSIVSHMVLVHQSVRNFSSKFLEQLRRYNYVTPKNYLDFIHNYKRALADNRTTFSGMAARLDGGLQKLIQVLSSCCCCCCPCLAVRHVPARHGQTLKGQCIAIVRCTDPLSMQLKCAFVYADVAS